MNISVHGESTKAEGTVSQSIRQPGVGQWKTANEKNPQFVNFFHDIPVSEFENFPLNLPVIKQPWLTLMFHNL